MADAWGGSWGTSWGNSWGGGSTSTGLPKGGHGRKKFRTGDLTRSQVEAWWDKRDALVARTKRLRHEEQREAVEASVEAVSLTLEAADGHSEALAQQFDTMIAAVERATKALSAQKVVAEAKKAAEAAAAILLAIEDENTAILLLLA